PLAPRAVGVLVGLVDLLGSLRSAGVVVVDRVLVVAPCRRTGSVGGVHQSVGGLGATLRGVHLLVRGARGLLVIPGAVVVSLGVGQVGGGGVVVLGGRLGLQLRRLRVLSPLPPRVRGSVVAPLGLQQGGANLVGVLRDRVHRTAGEVGE